MPELARVPAPAGREAKRAWHGALLAAALAAHALAFLVLFQQEFSQEQSARIRAAQSDPSLRGYLASVLRQEGARGLVTALWNGNRTVALYWRYAQCALGRLREPGPDGGLRVVRPYRDLAIEYPPLALAVIAVPALVSRGPAEYRFWLAAWLGALYLANVVLAVHLLEGRTPALRTLAFALSYSALFLLLFGDLAAARFDQVVPSFMLAAAWALVRGGRAGEGRPLLWTGLGGALAAAGAFAKFTPVLLLPAALLHLRASAAPNGHTRSLLAGALLAAAVLGAGSWLVLGEGALAGVLGYHAARGVEVESLWAGLAALANLAGLPLAVENSFGAFHLVTALTPWLKAAAAASFAGLVLLVRGRMRHAAASATGLLLGTAALLLAFLLASTVLSPQFLLWLAPFMAAFSVRPGLRPAAGLFLVAALLSQLVFPQLFEPLLRFEPGAILLLNLRNATLLALFALLLKARSEIGHAQDAVDG